mgnify:CR=1 FL=1
MGHRLIYFLATAALSLPWRYSPTDPGGAHAHELAAACARGGGPVMCMIDDGRYSL